jgi:AcrR family transcriptional regulator
MARRRSGDRYGELVAAAARTFSERGVKDTLVSDIVKAAGVAQGTFYLYFKTKDDIVLAVVDELVGRLQRNLTEAVQAEGLPAPERLRLLCSVLGNLTDLPGTPAIVDFMHRPENRVLHDRLVAALAPRLVDLMETVIRQGVAAGDFDVPDARRAAWFVLSGLQGTELSGVPLAEMPEALTLSADLALRALGYRVQDR